jgi:lysophospholipase L1-like esterase
MPQISPPASGYNSQLSAYNLTESSLRRWRSQLSKALVSTTSSARILCLGDSITEGSVGSTPQRLYNWPARLRTALAADGRAGAVGEGLVFPSGITLASYDERWSLGTGWSKVGGSIDGMFQSAPGGGTLSFPVPSCDSITIYWVRHTINGTWTYNVDGGASTGVNANGSIGMSSTTFSVSAGTHTLNIVPHATSGYAMIAGIEYHTTASRNDVEVITGGGHLGYTSGNFTSNGGFDCLETIDLIKPDLTIICLGRNDATGSVAPATFKTNMAAKIDRCRVTNSTDVMLLTAPPSSGGAYVNETQIRAALYALADEKDVCLVDLKKRFGSSWYQSPYNMSGDDIHPNDAGSDQLAKTVAGVVLN